MKILKIAFIIVYLFTGSCIPIANNNKGNLSMELSRIIINNVKIDSLLNIVIDNSHDYLNDKYWFLLLEYFHSVTDTNYVSVTSYEKEVFTTGYLPSNYPIGYFEVNNQIVLLVGDTCFDKIRFLDEKMMLEFKYYKALKRGSVPPPPRMYNPPIYTFLYEK
jgi:hypothetical protein